MDKPLDPGLFSLPGHMQGALAMNRLEGGISLGHIMTDRVDNRFRPIDRRSNAAFLPVRRRQPRRSFLCVYPIQRTW